MKKTRKHLTSIFWSIPVSGAVLALLFESDSIVPGAMAGSVDAEYVSQSIMVLVTLAAIPGALRLFKTPKVMVDLKTCKELALQKWGTTRLCMIGVPFVLNVLMYYLFMRASFGYLAIILLICLIFVYPTKDRCAVELQNDTDKE